jgi:hypothetical protein
MKKISRAILTITISTMSYLGHSQGQAIPPITWDKISTSKIDTVDIVSSTLTEGDGLLFSGVPGNIKKSKVSIQNTKGDKLELDTPAKNMILVQKMGKFLKSDFETNAKIDVFYDANIVGSIVFNETTSDSRNGSISTQIEKQSKKASVLPADDEKDFLRQEYSLKFKDGRYKYNLRTNTINEKNVIHIFLDDDGNFIKSSLPTTAREDNVYVFHVIHTYGNNKKYNLSYSGTYDPKITVYGTGDSDKDKSAANKGGKDDKTLYTEQVFGAIGPFTGTFQVKIVKTVNADNNSTTILEKSINAAPLHHITLNAGLFRSSLRDPQNIHSMVKPNGDSTLSADDPTGRGLITVMLTFYPHPRNMLYPSHSIWERIGFTIGTGISKNLSENFFGGLNIDIARGLAVVGGVHYGRRSVLIDNPDFKFGETKFTGALENRIVKKWDANFFIGVNIDFRLLSFLYTSATGGSNAKNPF